MGQQCWMPCQGLVSILSIKFIVNKLVVAVIPLVHHPVSQVPAGLDADWAAEVEE